MSDAAREAASILQRQQQELRSVEERISRMTDETRKRLAYRSVASVRKAIARAVADLVEPLLF